MKCNIQVDITFKYHTYLNHRGIGYGEDTKFKHFNSMHQHMNSSKTPTLIYTPADGVHLHLIFKQNYIKNLNSSPLFVFFSYLLKPSYTKFPKLVTIIWSYLFGCRITFPQYFLTRFAANECHIKYTLFTMNY